MSMGGSRNKMEQKPRHYNRHFEGILLGEPIDFVNGKLKDAPEGSSVLVTAFNCSELYVKEAGKVRTSTEKEYQNYFKKETK